MSSILKKIIFFSITLSVLLTPIFVVQAQYGIGETIKDTPLASFKSITLQTMTGNVLGAVLSLVGIVFFGLMIFGGITWMTAAGNQQKEKDAMNMILSASIGLILILSSYVLVAWVFNAFKTS